MTAPADTARTAESRLADIKQVFRAEAMAHRAELRERLGGQAGRRIARHFLDHYHVRRGSVVSAYWPLKGEADPLSLMASLRAHGCRLALPEVVAPATPLIFREWRPGQVLEVGPYGTAHPHRTAQRMTPDVVLVPLLAFDGFGMRLGYGGGYFDRTLAELRRRKRVTAIGVAFSGQEMSRLPRGRYDQPLDAVVTENGVRVFDGRRL